MGHSASLKITVAGKKSASCAHCSELQDRIEKLVAETRIIVSHIQKAAKRRSKPTEEIAEANKDITEALKTLEKITDDVSGSFDGPTEPEKPYATKLVTGGKPMLLMPAPEVIKGVGVDDILDDSPDYSDYSECLKCDDTGTTTNKHGALVPCKWCNPGGKGVAIPGDHVKCPWCHAKDAVVGSCLRCDGCGHVPYDTVFTPQGLCRTCNGGGKVYGDSYSMSTTACDFCGGFGKDPSMVNTEKPPGKTVCLHCDGTGIAHVGIGANCSICSGKGWTS
jgi:hypothetical protein